MAIKQAYTTEHGFDLPEAYWRIESFRGDRQQTRVNVSIYKDKLTRDENKQAVASIEFTVPTPAENQNLFASVYQHMKQNELTLTNTGKSVPFTLSNPEDI